MKIVVCLVIVLCSFCIGSYGQFLQDINGRPYLITNYSEYQGSPFLFDDWKIADVITAKDDRLYKILVNVDVYGNTVLFNRNDSVYMFVEEIKEFNINEGSTNYVYKKGKILHPLLPDVFMQVLSATPLLAKKVVKQLAQVQEYGSANKIQKFAQVTEYYGVIGGTINKIKLTKADAQNFFYNKWSQIQDYAFRNNISYKTNEGWMQLLSFYRSLQ